MSIEAPAGMATPERSEADIQRERRAAFDEDGWVVYLEDSTNTRGPEASRNKYLLVQFDQARLDESRYPEQAARHVVVVDMETKLVIEPLPDARLMWSGQWRLPDEDLTVAGVLSCPGLQFRELLDW